MKTSLKQILNDEIKHCGFISAQEVFEIAKREGHKQSNAERRLRQSESPNVKTIYSTEGPRAIIGYEWIEKEIPQINIENCNQPARLFEMPRMTSI